jgi:hypothetical protein
VRGGHRTPLAFVADEIASASGGTAQQSCARCCTGQPSRLPSALSAMTSGDDSVGGALPRVTDLRGRTAATADPVLVDPTGRRARRLRLGGRMLAAVFSMWLCALVLAGLGAFPVELPLSGVHELPKVRSAPDPRSPDVSALHRQVSAARRSEAPSGVRQPNSSVSRTSRSNPRHRSVARTPGARTQRRAGTSAPRPMPSTRGSRRAQPVGSSPAHAPRPVSPSGKPSGSSGASASAPGHQIGSAGSPGASASAPGHQIATPGSSGASASAPGQQAGPGGSPSAPGTGAPTTAAAGRGASGSASDHGRERTSGSGTPSG